VFSRNFAAGIMVRIKLILSGFFTALFLCAGVVNADGQNIRKDTLRIMHYNLLYYGHNFAQCDNTTNNIIDKDAYFKTICDHVQPDVITVNEIGCKSILGQRVLANVLNNEWAVAPLKDGGGQDICNMVFYNSSKLMLAESFEIDKNRSGSSALRVTDGVRLVYKAGTDDQQDSISIYGLTAHLKASSGSQNESRRYDQTGGVMDYISSNLPKGNIFFSGDFNVYTSSEAGYQELINFTQADYRFNDPINKSGSWHNNSAFSQYFTQSTRTSSSGCHVTGGMDDRFDFILMSSDLISGDKSAKYIPGSYYALGQDGNRFNGSINSPTNTSEPAAVISALYGMSDHLPVIADLEVTYIEKPSSISEFNVPDCGFSLIKKGNLWESKNSDPGLETTNRLMSLDGTQVKTWNQMHGSSDIQLNLSAGLYILISEGTNSSCISRQKILIP
jgi:hypothetical protein